MFNILGGRTSKRKLVLSYDNKFWKCQQTYGEETQGMEMAKVAFKLIQEANFYEKVKSKLGIKDLKIKKNQHKKNF